MKPNEIKQTQKGFLFLVNFRMESENLKTTEDNYLRRLAIKEQKRVRFLSVEKIDWVGS